MNINSYNPIKSINIEALQAEVDAVEVGSGTYKDLFKMVLEGNVIACTNNSGDIMTYWIETKKDALLDHYEGQKFIRAYAGKNITDAIHLGWAFLAKGFSMDDISIEEHDSYAEIVTIEDKHYVVGNIPAKGKDGSEPACELDDDEELPSEVEIRYSDLRQEDAVGIKVKDYLRAKYKHCLKQGANSDLMYEWDKKSVTVKNIQWGRKLTEAEHEALCERIGFNN